MFPVLAVFLTPFLCYSRPAPHEEAVQEAYFFGSADGMRSQPSFSNLIDSVRIAEELVVEEAASDFVAELDEPAA